MRIYRATEAGKSVGLNPNSGNTPGLKVVNFLRKRNWIAPDDLILEWTGVSRYDLQELERKHIIQAVG